mmetsp:Transcript_44489/g.37370  ORF Transcript_44489/g.37370 Transcript_44489/m.37370 type:complete len:114 (-) Transcript_44489:214-555(-)
MAPEVLSNNGYSFSVDIWGVGVVLYTMVTGLCPFEGRTVDETYNKIKTNNYLILKNMDSDFKKLIKKIFKLNPSSRPSLKDIKDDPFFTNNPNIDDIENIIYKSNLKDELLTR